MSKHEDIRKSIHSLDLFNFLGPENLENLLNCSSSIVLQPGEELFPFGSETSSLYYIVSGEIIIYYNRKIISRLASGEYFGEIALIDNGPRSASAKAGPETQVIEFPAQICRDLFCDEAEVWEGISKVLCKRLRATNIQIVEQYEHFNMNVHDMKNFLSTMTYAELVANNLPKEDKENQEYLSCIISAKESIEDLMDSALAQIQDISSKSKILFDEKEVNIISLVAECVAGLDAHKDIKRMAKVNLNTTIEIPMLCCNSLNIKRVVSNLIINAAQASDDGSEINVSVSESDGNMIVEVSDSGGGMSNDTMEHIFEQFYTTKSDGYGLGLASCKEIVEAHGGALTCSSVLGAGSRFFCKFPINIDTAESE